MKKVFSKSFTLVFIFIFIFVPVFLLLLVSISKQTYSLPPYKSIFNIGDDFINININISHYKKIFTESIFLRSLINSMTISLIVILITLTLSFPVGYFLSSLSGYKKFILFIFIVLPSVILFTVRTYMWIEVFQYYKKFISTTEPNYFIKIIIYMTHSYLPFMVIPIYSAIEKVPKNIIEAAYDLGCKPFYIFIKIILPMIKNGVINGIIFVSIPMLSDFVVTKMFSEGKYIVIGELIWSEFFINKSWPTAAAIALVLLVLISSTLIAFINRSDD